MHSILVRDYMQRDTNAISVSANIAEVVSRLVKGKIPGAPVIDDKKTVVGFVSEQDCIKEMLNNAMFCDEPPSVTKVMQTDVLTVTPNTSIVEIAQTMLKHKPKIYPVVDDGKLVGIINRSLILKALVENDEDCYLRT
ncbi:CBS domain-containing protein [Marinimicrobium alkaliphilum]|uniref:CBS domain-containing protein n=1 Tax=Marinimicrobium alkaliphilum TaxID=2202654 RepID=UPI000DB97CDF|nr:CBS domain-containing protein [Marinimicrobium alkaliphilum]